MAPYAAFTQISRIEESVLGEKECDYFVDGGIICILYVICDVDITSPNKKTASASIFYAVKEDSDT